MNHKTQGFTLLELLIVIAIIGILAAVLIPNLLRTRQVANDRAATAYGQNVYKAAQGYLAEKFNATSVATDCQTGYTPAVGSSFNVPAPGAFVTACTIVADATKVNITYTGGTSTTVQIGR